MTQRASLPVILCLEPDRAEQEQLLESLADALPANTFELTTARSAEEALKLVDRLVQGQREIAMVVSAQRLPDGMGDSTLVKLYEKWPHAIRILLVDEGMPVSEERVREAKVYRVLNRPVGKQELRYALQEAGRYFQQRLELDEKSRILGELHRASMSLTGEIHLSKLLHKLMRIVVDNADAENGYILLQKDDESVYIAAVGHTGSYETEMVDQAVGEQTGVCPAIVDSARKTKDTIILADALNDGMFMHSPYVRRHLLRSVLCTPLVYQGKLFGLLYLENRNKVGAFSSYSLELFRMLSAQAAIAIQNAQLYEELEQKVEERTAEVRLQSVELERQRDEIVAKNDDILGSIRYARRIQDAFLPKIADIRDVFPQSFVYYKPKDIVSGDFFWFSQRLSKAIIATADCTGHGIPGAFMTIMANTLLRQIVEIEGLFKPDEILYQLNLRVRIALNQGGEGPDTSRDGLDIALCQIDPKRGKLQYAGANRPLLIVRGQEIIELKPDKYPIGGEQVEDERHYTLHNFELQTGDTLYMFTDGYPDQIGEEINKRFKSRRFHQLLMEYQDKDMDHQRLLLDAELRHWRGDMEQTDDILVMGLRM